MRIRAGASAIAAVIGFAAVASAQDIDAGRKSFESRCARCHGADGNGGEMGPAIRERLPARDDKDLRQFIHTGVPARGMPPTEMPSAEMDALVKFLRSIERRPESKPIVRTTVRTTDGKTLDGQLMGEGFDDMQVLGDDKRLHLLRRAGERYREVTSQNDWPTYNGDPRGNRYTTMTQITRDNVSRLSPKWVFTIPGGGSSQATPSVVGGVMYVAHPNECFALDAGTGRQIWRYQRPRSKAPTAAHANRGVSIAGDRLFMVSDDAHLLALNRFTGELLWDTTLDDWRKNYASSSAPLVAGNLVVAGVTGGEHGANGFLAAHDQQTGKEVWRFWTVPRRGEPGSETWQGKDIDHGGAPTWFTGSYDPELDIVYWPVGNPAKEYNGDDRKGDNLYSGSILALQRADGKLKWHYQFTPHDLWDWDATQTSVLVDANWEGKPRKLMLHANRNGFFYVFDRTDGKLLLAKPFIKRLTWASGIGADGRPIKLPEPGPLAGRHQGVPVAGRRDELVFAVVQSFDRSLLRAVQREVQHLHEGRPGRMGERQDLSGRFTAHSRRSRSRSGCCARLTSRPAPSSGRCRSLAPPIHGAARSRPPPASSSSATTAAAWSRSTRCPASRCGASRRIRTGGPRR